MAYHVSAAPHVREHQKSSHIMYLVLLSLCPAAIAGAVIFGFRAILLMTVTVAACMGAEALWQFLTKQKITVSDGSAAVTGLLLSFTLPVTLPFWMAALGGAFAVIIAKALFGGLGNNFMNPALCGRAFLLASFPVAMTTWALPLSRVSIFGGDAITGATPLAILKMPEEGVLPGYSEVFWGNVGGCIGESCAPALILGGLILLFTRVITWHIPVAYLGSAALLSYILDVDPLFALLAGGILLGAFFMATDYVTSPLTRKGQFIFGLGCGLLTVIIRKFGAYPEGVTYAILLMNAATPLIDRFTSPKPFGEGGKKHA